MNILFTILISILYFAYIASSQSCDSWTDAVECVTDSGGACKYVNGLCRCVSEVELDILFGVDTSGSIGADGFAIQKQFIENLVVQGINNGSRIGFTMFSTNINESRSIQYWNTDELILYTRGILWTSGFTNTPGLLTSALTTFAETYDPERQQVLMLITDGNPCLPDSQGGCPQGVCQYANQVKSAGIRVVIIGIGEGLDTQYVGCLTQSDDDFIPVSGFSTEAFESIMGSVSDILCPISKQFKVTEVKAEKKTDDTWNSRWTRFVEVYNTGIDFTLDDIEIDGLISMNYGDGPSNITVSQGQYVVFYDASDLPTGNNDVLSTPSCHLCEDPCDLTGCISTDESYTGYCWCGNSIYIACGNENDAESICTTNVEVTGGQNACSVCTFNDDMSKTNWEITFSDSASEIDSVIYDSLTWITTDDGYSYELLSKGFDNDLGDNWAQSCSVFGTPGSDPAASCSTTCNSDGIDCGDGGYCDTNTGLCVCDEDTGYYPDCTDPTTCLKCKLIPTIAECQVVWRKNGTDKYAFFNWSETATDADGGYILYWFDASVTCDDGIIGGSAATGCDVITDNPTYVNALAQRIDNYYTYNNTIGGYVTSYIKVCDDEGLSCDEYESARIPCVVITQSPTFSPTNSPTNSPTAEPTKNPTASPTWECPLYWWENEDVCNPDTDDGYAGDRCTCTGDKPKQCCLLEPDWTGTYDPDRQHKTDYECKLDVELDEPKKRFVSEDEAGTADGYFLSQGEHTFIIEISPENYPCKMDIYWELQFTDTDCNGRRRLKDSNSTNTVETIVCDPDSTDLTQAGLSIDVTSGWLKVWGQNDVENSTVTFTVTRLDCDEALAIINGGNEIDSRLKRRRLGDSSCFDDIQLNGDLVIINATSECQPDCYDGRIYPMRIPVWYNWQVDLSVIPSNEKELPAWLWWLIAALVVFLCILTLLVYKYWWKNREKAVALNSMQDALDQEICIAENGWIDDLNDGQVQVNRMIAENNRDEVTNPNPNQPPFHDAAAKQFVTTNIEKPVFRKVYGPKHGDQYD